MKKGVASKIDSLLSGLIGRLEKLESVAVEQFPDFCKEIVAERKVQLQNNVIQATLFSLATIPVTYYLIAYSFVPEHGDGRILSSIFAFAFGIGAIFSVISLVSEFLELRILKAAPRVYVLKQLRKMIGK